MRVNGRPFLQKNTKKKKWRIFFLLCFVVSGEIEQLRPLLNPPLYVQPPPPARMFTKKWALLEKREGQGGRGERKFHLARCPHIQCGESVGCLEKGMEEGEGDLEGRESDV